MLSIAAKKLKAVPMSITMLSIGMTRTRFASAAFLAVAALAAPLSAQTFVAEVSTLGPGCGSAAPTLSSTIPLIPGNITFHLQTTTPNASCDLFLSPPPVIVPISVLGCSVYVNPLTFIQLGPFVTDPNGVLVVTYDLPNVPALVDLFCSLQGVCVSPNGIGFSNGVGLYDGNASPFCTYSQGGYQGGGAPGAVLTNNFVSTFSSVGYMEVGVYGNNGATVPNGIRFNADAAGLAALQTWLGGGGSSVAFGTDTINPTSTGGGVGGGNIGKQATTLTLNIAFNDGAVAGSPLTGFSSLVYRNPGDSLDGLTVAQIMAVTNNALAGLGLPAGHTFGTLNVLVSSINLSFDPCVMSAWARLYLFAN